MYLSLIIFKINILVSQVRELREIVRFKVSSIYLNNETQAFNTFVDLFLFLSSGSRSVAFTVLIGLSFRRR